MARLVEESDSEGEFPDIKDVLKGVKGKPKPSPRKKAPVAASKPDETKRAPAKGKGKGASALKETFIGKDQEMDEESDSPKTVERSIKKKRVLGKRDDNPLLRPIGKTAREARVRNRPSVLTDYGSDEESKKIVTAARGGKERKAKAAPPAPYDEEDGCEDPGRQESSSEQRKAEEARAGSKSRNRVESKSTKRGRQPVMQRQMMEDGSAAEQRQIMTYRSLQAAQQHEDIPPTLIRLAVVNKGLLHSEEQMSKVDDGLLVVEEKITAERARKNAQKATEVDAMKLPESISSTGRLRAVYTTMCLDSEEGSPGEVQNSEALGQLEVPSTNTIGLSAEGFRLSKGSKVGHTKPSESALLLGEDNGKSRAINLDSDVECLDPSEGAEELPKRKPQRLRKQRHPPPRTKSKFILTDTEEEDSLEDDDSDGMSDFIVSDNEPLEEEDDDSVFEVPPPATRSVRKLFRGRRPNVDGSEDESGLDKRMRKLRVHDDDEFHAVEEGKGSEGKKDDASPKNSSTTGTWKLPTKSEALVRSPPKTKEDEAPPASSDIEDSYTLRFSPSGNKRKVSKEARFATPPASPKLIPRQLPSPAKVPRIPNSPHRQSSDAFWSQDVINDWNDEYSPRKTPKSILKPLALTDGKLLFSPRKDAAKQDRLTKDAKKAFSQIKREMAQSFLNELDEKITHGKIAEMAASTGGVKIIWSKKLNTTAGRANWKRETIRPKAPQPNPPTSSTSQPPPAPSFRHHAAIELAEKVIDDEDRLLNVVAHEFCHLATFMVSNIRTNPHGKEFKAWASKCSKEFVHRGIEVTTKHSYEIEYKYVWECENCGMQFKRHSKSIDVGKHRCGVCKSKLVQTKPVPRKEGGGGGLTSYQAFVKENMKRVREENPGSPQKEIMGLVGKKYQEFKASKLKESDVPSVDLVESKEGTPDDDLGTVVRKLDFLDLTSP